MIEPQSNLSESQILQTFLLSPSRNKQNSFLFLLSIRTFKYISLYSYTNSQVLALRVSMAISQGERNYVSESEHRLYAR